MSFAQDVKQEIAARKITRPCCSLAACYGFACFGRYFDQNGTVLQTESLPVAQLARRMFALNGIQGELVEKINGMLLEDELFVRDDPKTGTVRKIVLQ